MEPTGSDMIEWVSEWSVAIAATLAAMGVIYRLGVRPLIRGIRVVRDFMKTVTMQMNWVAFQMTPNHGTSMFDKVNNSEEAISEITKEMKTMKNSVSVLQQSVTTLLEHDESRDIEGFRYGPVVPEEVVDKIVHDIVENIKGDEE